MSLQRYEPPANEVIHDRHYMDGLEKKAELFARSNLCPDQFRGKPADIAVIGYSLADLGLRLTLSTLKECYVIHGRPDYMAQLQAGLAERYGYRIKPDERNSTNEIGIVHIMDLDGEIHEVTFTKEDAVKAGLWNDAKKLYGKYPKDMLINRATTRAIKRHAPAVMLGLSAGNFVGMDDVDAADAAVEPAEPVAPEMVPAAYAKTKLVEAYSQDLPEEPAKALAKELWDKHGLGKDPIPPDLFDELLREALAPHREEEIEDAEVVEDAEIVQDGEPFD